MHEENNEPQIEEIRLDPKKQIICIMEKEGLLSVLKYHDRVVAKADPRESERIMIGFPDSLTARKNFTIAVNKSQVVGWKVYYLGQPNYG